MDVIEQKETIRPFIKWPGGKQQLAKELLARMPSEFSTYHEPFLGSGALFLAAQPREAHLIDRNFALINAWAMILKMPEKVERRLRFLDEGILEGGEHFYLQARESYNQKLLAKEDGAAFAALFLFLNKHAFNGLYRVNRKGLFNVPWNKSTQPTFPAGTLPKIQEKLKNNTLIVRATDFSGLRGHVKKGDFVYLDPPAARRASSSFRSYTEEPFTAEDHARLAVFIYELDRLGAYIMLTNSNTTYVKSLYKKFNMEELSMRTNISRNAASRMGSMCLVVRNYG